MTRYQKEGLNQFLVMPCSDKKIVGYQSMLLQRQMVSPFLQYELRELDGKRECFFRIQYHTVLQSVMDHMNYTIVIVKQMLRSICDCFFVSDEYFLNPEQILWDARYMFIEVNTGKMQFCYCPLLSLDCGGLKEFLSEWLECVSRKEEESRLLILKFYNLLTEPNYEMCDIEGFYNKYLKENTLDRGITKAENKWEDDRLEEMQEMLLETPMLEVKHTTSKESTFKIDISQILKGMIIVLGIINLVLTVCLCLDILPYNSMWCIFVGMGCLIVVTILYMGFEKEESVDEIMQEYMENSDSFSEIEILMNEKEKVTENEVTSYGETTILQQGMKDQTIDEVVLEEVPRQLYLMPVKPHGEQPIYIENDSVVIGCMRENCDYVLSETGVSRMHAKIIKKEDGLFVFDLNSTNGTYVNGELIESGCDHKIEEGDMVAFSVAEFYVVRK